MFNFDEGFPFVMPPAGAGMFQFFAYNNPSQPLIFERYDQRLGKLFEFKLPKSSTTRMNKNNNNLEATTTTPSSSSDDQNARADVLDNENQEGNNIGASSSDTPTPTSNDQSTSNDHSNQIIQLYETLQKCNPSFPQEPCVIPEKCQTEIEKFYSAYDDEDEKHLFNLLVDANVIASGPIVFNVAGTATGFNGGRLWFHHHV